MSEKRNMPEEIKRQIRQRCGFGCVICGSPIYQYEHIYDFAKFKRHVAEEITLLCPTHHQQVTGKLISKDTVKKQNHSPHNLSIFHSIPWKLFYEFDNYEIIIGGNIFKRCFGIRENEVIHIPIEIRKQPIIKLKEIDGHIVLDMILFNEMDIPVLVIKENELVFSVDFWDVTFIGNTLSVREGKGKFFIQVTFDTPNRLILNKGKILYRGIEIKINDKMITVNGGQIQFSGNILSSFVGLAIG